LLSEVGTARRFAPALTIRASDREVDRFRTALRAAGDARVDVDAAVAAVRAVDGRRAVDEHVRALSRWARQLDVAAARSRAAASGALLAMCVASFNEAFALSISSSSTRIDERLVEEAGSSMARLGAVWGALREDHPAAIWAGASEMRDRAGRLLFGLAVPAAAAAAVSRVGSEADPALGRRAVNAGSLLRSLLFEVALARALLWANGWSLPERRRAWVDAARRAARPRPGYRWPNATSIRWLTETGLNRADGSDRMVEGLVLDVDISHRAGKAVSDVTISDGQRVLTAVLPYIKVDSAGLAAGAWCRMAGTWHASSPETGGPALHIDRRALAELATEGWIEGAQLELLGEFTPVPHALAIEWSWQPGRGGAAAQLVHKSWYSARSLRHG
jgi:hypothetical protein